MQLPVSDRLFRHAFSTQQSARELAENFLPPAYRRRITGARVTVERSSYVAQIYSDLLRRKKQPQQLPEIVPLVLYSGAKRWGYPLQLAELVAASRNATHVPRFRPLLVDLARRKDNAFNGGVRTVVALLFRLCHLFWAAFR